MAEEMKQEAQEERTEENMTETVDAPVADEQPAEAEKEAEVEKEAEKGPEKKRSFFGKSDKNEKLEKALKEAEDKQKAASEQLQRTMAEFDNFRKRTDKEKAAMFDIGAKSVLEKLLPVVDNFERGLEGMTEEQKAEPFAAGMDAVYKQLKKMLDELDVKPIAALGEIFDPDKHNAVMHVESDEAGENVIVQEFQKGYTYHDIVIRYSMVKVAN